MTDSQSASMSWYQATIWDLQPIFLLLPWKVHLDSWGFAIMGLHVWREDGSVIYICWWALAVRSFLCLSSAGLMTIFYCHNFETPPTWRARSPYLYPLGTGWSSYTLGHWVPFLLPHTTHRAMMEVFYLASTLGY
jgi:hypothetical protein